MSTQYDDRPWIRPRTAYIHIPFCAHQCGYCDFAVSAGDDDLIDPYLDALELELHRPGEPMPVESIFIGGGTPTYLDASRLTRLMNLIAKRFPFLDYPNREYSIESTPESLDQEKIAILAEGGINRVSIGVQSFQSRLLTALDRAHGVDQISRAVELVRRRIPSYSLDLIFAAPSQTLAEWDRDLAIAVHHEPDHISTYGLTYEKGTPIWKQRQRGLLKTVDENDELAMYELAMDRLTTSGFEQYEISNFARPGYRCRHNERYWANEAYYGFGVGAARYVELTRELNVRDTALYIRRLKEGTTPVFQSECLPPRERAFETLAVQLRRSDGISRSPFLVQTEFELDSLVGQQIAGFVSNGLITDDGSHVALTRRGRCVADAMIERLMTER